MNLYKLSTQELVTLLSRLESQGRFCAAHERLRLYADWRKVSAELNTRPTSEALAG